MYWAIILLILIVGAAILAKEAVDGQLALTGQILMTVLAFAIFWNLMIPVLRQIKNYWRENHDDHNVNSH